MTNDEITAAIERTHKLLMNTPESYPLYKLYCIHAERLLQIEYERAKKIEVKVVQPDSQTACICVPVRADRTVLSVVVDCPIHGAKK